MSLLAILGRQPELGRAELESLLGPETITPVHLHAVLIEAEVSEVPFKRLGGTIKLCKLLNILDTTDWTKIEQYLVQACAEYSTYLPEGKLTVGLSAYGFKLSSKIMEKTGLSIKKAVRGTGRPVRLVPNKEPEMTAAQIIHNKLTHEHGWDLVLYRDGNRTLLARTNFVQDIEAYSARDQARPKRDARVGMLPPKLAQIIINLATGSEVPADTTLLDPFCGTGVVLQEAALMGMNVYGTDSEPRMAEYSIDNLSWLKTSFEVGFKSQVELGDVTTYKWKEADKIKFVACETFLGKPMSGQDSLKSIEEERTRVQQLLKAALKNLGRQITPGTRCCFAVPAWFFDGRTITLPLIDQLTDMGYNQIRFKAELQNGLIYRREGQVVGRQLITCVKE